MFRFRESVKPLITYNHSKQKVYERVENIQFNERREGDL